MYQNIFCRVAECLGVKLYKKYWPDGGSWWNTKHIDPNNGDDLERVILNSNDLANNHFIQMINENFIMIASILCSYYFSLVDNKGLSYLVTITSILTLRHLYGIMVHTYNKYIAHDKLSKLPNDQLNGVEKTYDSIWDLSELNISSSLIIHRIYLKNMYIGNLELYFKNKEHALLVLNQLNNMNDDMLFQFITNKIFRKNQIDVILEKNK